MSELLGIDIKKLDYGVFQFYQTVLIQKLLEATCMDYFNGVQTPIKVDVPIGTDNNGYEAKRDWTNSYDSVIGMMLYLE